MLGMNAFCGLLDRQPLSVVPDDLALSCVDVGIFQCGVDPTERVERVFPSDEPIHSRKSSTKGLSSKGCSACRLPIG
jgi:hypothetical protein